MEMPEDLDALAREVIDANRYMTLGTSEPDGRPRVSPVYFTHDGYRDLYWVSSPDAQHSANVVARPEVAIVIYDSTAAVGDGRAVYLGADAVLVPDDELPERCRRAWAGISKGARAFTPDELSGDGDLRLFCATVTTAEVHLPGGDPRNRTGVDHRVPVEL